MIALDDSCERFDEVVIAVHSDVALRMLADPAPAETDVLGAIPYQRNEAVLHTDASLMPKRRSAWASWNYHLIDRPTGRTTVTYHMNRLQSLVADRDYLVTLNLTEAIDPATVIRKIDYAHPVFTPEGVAAQRRWAEISGLKADPLLRGLLAVGVPRGRRLVGFAGRGEARRPRAAAEGRGAHAGRESSPSRS